MRNEKLQHLRVKSSRYNRLMSLAEWQTISFLMGNKKIQAVPQDNVFTTFSKVKPDGYVSLPYIGRLMVAEANPEYAGRDVSARIALMEDRYFGIVVQSSVEGSVTNYHYLDAVTGELTHFRKETLGRVY